MRENDGRKLSHEALEQIRIRAVMRVHAGESPGNVIRTLGFSRGRIYEWLAAYRGGGMEALRAKPVPGRPLKLSAECMNFVYDVVTERSPMHRGFASTLWSRDSVRELIQREFGISLSKNSVVRLLARLGLSGRQPLSLAYERNPQLTEAWAREQYPAILREAKSIGAQIMFVDEAPVEPNDDNSVDYSASGVLISAINSHREVRFMFSEGALSIEAYIEFVTRLLLSEEGPLFLIADGDPIHRAMVVQQLAEQSDGRLRVFQLPV